MSDASGFDQTEAQQVTSEQTRAHNGSRNRDVFADLAHTEPEILTDSATSTAVTQDGDGASESRLGSFFGGLLDLIQGDSDSDPVPVAQAPPTSPGAHAEPYEVLFADFTRVLPDNSLREAIKAELREILGAVTDAPQVVSEAGRLANHRRKWIEQLQEILELEPDSDGQSPIELELTNLDVQIIARARITADHLNQQQFLSGLAKLPPDDADLGERGVDFTEVTSPPIAAVKFKPGSLSFSPTTILPTKASVPLDLVEAVAHARQSPPLRPITVAVIDTGIDHEARETHPLFTGVNADDPLGGSRDREIEPPPDGVVDQVYGHGTHVAGIVAARAPHATINHESVRRGSGLSDAFELARDMEDILQASIVVFSFATSSPSEHDIPVLRAVIAHLLSSGKVVVAAAGTTFDLVRPSDQLFPADLNVARMVADLVADAVLGGRTASVSPNQLISVGAVDVDGVDMPGTRSVNRSNHVKSYGVGITSAFPARTVRWGNDGPSETYNGWANWTGTSMAAPRVAGAIAAHFQANPHLSLTEAADQVVERARGNGDIVD